jgi:nucleoside-diphosphate-sugar epimerase
MRLFITGATGFIGSHLVNQAHDFGHEVVALKRTYSSKPRVALNKQPIWVVASLDNVPAQAIARCDAIIHLAAHTPNVPYDSLENCFYWNVLAPLNLFRKAISTGIQRLVIAGSCFEYGKSGERYEFIPPNAPLEPTQTYAASKAAATIAFSQFAIETNIKLSILRIFQVYGDGELETRFWPSLRAAAIQGRDFPMTRGEQVRDFISVQDVAAKFREVCTNRGVEPGCPEVHNIGTGAPMTILEFAQHWWNKWAARGRLLPGAVPYRQNEVMRYVPELTL